MVYVGQDIHGHRSCDYTDQSVAALLYISIGLPNRKGLEM